MRSFFAKLFLSNRFEVLQHIKNSREGLDQYHGGGMNLRLKVRGLKDERTLQVKFSFPWHAVTDMHSVTGRPRVTCNLKSFSNPVIFSASAPAVECSFTAWVNIKSIWKQKIL